MIDSSVELKDRLRYIPLMHWEILDPKRKKLFSQFGFLKQQGFYLAGGTALALQIGHRTSIDFDFYTLEDFQNPLELQIILRKIFPDFSMRHIADGILIGVTEGIELGFFRYPYPLLNPLIEREGVFIASLTDLIAMKKENVFESIQFLKPLGQLNSADLEQHKKFIITRVLNRGSSEEVHWLRQTYHPLTIRSVLKNPARGVWFPQVLNFWLTIYEMKISKKKYQKALFSLDPQIPPSPRPSPSKGEGD